MFVRVARLLLASIVVVSLLGLNEVPEISAQSYNCQTIQGTVYVYRYPSSQVGSALYGSNSNFPDYPSCLASMQGVAIDQCRMACQNGGFYGGTPGVAYCQVSWPVYWMGNHQGTPFQQYDCGDL